MENAKVQIHIKNWLEENHAPATHVDILNERTRRWQTEPSLGANDTALYCRKIHAKPRKRRNQNGMPGNSGRNEC